MPGEEVEAGNDWQSILWCDVGRDTLRSLEYTIGF